MHDSDTTPPQDPRAELEVRIVAWLLGEASAFEAAQLQTALEQDAQLAAFHERMRRTIGLVQAAYPMPAAAGQPAAEQPKLSRQRRRALLARFKVLKAPFASAAAAQAGFWIRWGIPLKVAAAFLVLIGVAWVFLYPKFTGASASAHELAQHFLTNEIAAMGEKETELAQRRIGRDLGRGAEQERLNKEIPRLESYGLRRPSSAPTEGRRVPAESSLAPAARPAAAKPAPPPTLGTPLKVYLPSGGAMLAAEQAGDAFAGKPELVELADKLGLVEAPTAGFPAPGAVEALARGKEQVAEWAMRGRVAAGDNERKFGTAFAVLEGQPGAAGLEMGGFGAHFNTAQGAPSSLFSDQYGGQGGGGGGLGGSGGGGTYGGGAGGYGGVNREGLLSEDLSLAIEGKRSAPAPDGEPRQAGTFLYSIDSGRTAEAASGLAQLTAKTKAQEKFSGLARSEGGQVPQLGDLALMGRLFKADESREKGVAVERALARDASGVRERYAGVKAAELPDDSKSAGEKKSASEAAGVQVAVAPEAPATAASPPPVAAAAVPPSATPGGGNVAAVSSVSVAGVVNLPKAAEAGGAAAAVKGPATLAQVKLRALAEPAQQVAKERARGVEPAGEQGIRAGARYEGKQATQSDSAGKPLSAERLAEKPPAELDRLALAPQVAPAQTFATGALEAVRDVNGEGPSVRKTAPAVPPPPPEINALENPFSTFSLNVSDVSFKLAAASLESGVLPEPAAIRAEEFINAFNYRDPAPAPGARLAFAWERARYPFAHNRDILRFAIQTAALGREPGKPLNLVVLLDNSGSMERPDRVLIVREALSVLAQQLQPQDRISVVAFARTPRLWVDGMAGGDAQSLLNKVLQLNPYGGTNLELAMALAYATAEKHFLPAGNNRVILLTDGAANLGDVDPESLKRTVEEHRRKGIALDCFGIGWEGYNDDLLEVLSRNGDGRYGFLNDPEQAGPEFADQLAGALNVAAADVKAQVEFNPRRVVAYRQIGYAHHQLTKEQFRDNTVDAAEIGAAESGNALYVIQVNAQGAGPLGVVRVRYKVPASGGYVEQQWVLPYESAVPPLDRASPAMRLAATAASFAEWLARSPYAEEVTPAALQSALRGVPETYAPDPRPQRLAAMLQAARTISGQ